MSSNPDSILDSVKKFIGFDSEYTAFDLDVTMAINMAFIKLKQVGAGSDTGFLIQDNTTLWSQYTSSLAILGLAKMFITLTAKLAFDPPDGRYALPAFQNEIQDLLWRINVEAEQENPPSNPPCLPSYYEVEDDEMGGVLKSYFAPKVVQLQYASVITPDASQGNVFYLTLTGDCTINAPVNGADGEHITLELMSAGFTVTWSSGWDFGDPGAPVLSSDKADIISAYFRQSAVSWRAGFTSGF